MWRSYLYHPIDISLGFQLQNLILSESSNNMYTEAETLGLNRTMPSASDYTQETQAYAMLRQRQFDNSSEVAFTVTASSAGRKTKDTKPSHLSHYPPEIQEVLRLSQAIFMSKILGPLC
jgi:hypothetical protein